MTALEAIGIVCALWACFLSGIFVELYGDALIRRVERWRRARRDARR